MGDSSFAGGVKANPKLYSRYEVLERLGEGTYGEVLKGKRKLDGLIVAMKERRDPQCATREAEALLALSHPNVVKLIEYFVQGANLILVLEFLPLDLYRVLEGSDGRIPEAQVKGWMLQILRGVAACHHACVLHWDLKPSNLLVGLDGTVKVSDFGQARVVLQRSADLLGINDTIFKRDEVKSTYNMEKEEIDAWISGSPVAKSAVKEYTEMRAAGSSEGRQRPPATDTDYVVGQCFCVTNDKGGFQGRPDDKSATGDTVGCRSLNCSMVKREGLIVARSNHFVEMEQKMETVKSAHDEELGRREWVLAEKNMVNSEQEKDGDFFCKLRSFPKRRGRKPQKHFRVSDTLASIMTLGEAVGFYSEACLLVDSLRGRLRRAAASVATQQRPGVLLLQGMDSLHIGGHWAFDMVTLAGGSEELQKPRCPPETLHFQRLTAYAPEVLILAPRWSSLDRSLAEMEMYQKSGN